ncbi:hypothetical protein DFR55_1042 [Herbinix hemicellulosilytica]|uniref:Uncharacterized protein n=1 Tax=Herbinix hemicellulosilytica TaxID=1564487 RepID=A0A0H5SJ66_HERHM|nr:hypothetical protein [Herbinix hemicellulosilytica]RBP59747.1 hypothetical protein DFR55_1042 [Herbinix hemicellulosilytica]CRZ35135.1 hypothetical protein HHT355_1936 [Herbinix hemicellulosilytica]
MIFRKRNTDIPDNEDDNLVVANMNVEGMPWYRGGKPLNINEENGDRPPLPELSKKDLRRITLSATLGGLLVGLVFIFILFLFIMFCVHVWFK